MANSISIFHPNKILTAIDGSDNSRRALKVAIDLARDYKANLIIVHVIPLPGFRAVEPGAVPEYFDEEIKEGNEILKGASTEAAEEGVKARSQLLQAKSSVVSEIIGYAEKEKTDLIVIGTRGKGGFARLVLGSVAGGIVSHARSEVLVVR